MNYRAHDSRVRQLTSSGNPRGHEEFATHEATSSHTKSHTHDIATPEPANSRARENSRTHKPAHSRARESRTHEFAHSRTHLGHACGRGRLRHNRLTHTRAPTARAAVYEPTNSRAYVGPHTLVHELPHPRVRAHKFTPSRARGLANSRARAHDLSTSRTHEFAN